MVLLVMGIAGELLLTMGRIIGVLASEHDGRRGL
jgi:hypothetical protein